MVFQNKIYWICQLVVQQLNKQIDSMTLYLELTKVHDLPHKINLYVEGSQAGPVYTKKGSNILGFKIVCSKKSVLKIQVFGEHFDRPDSNSLIGELLFSSPRFVEQNRQNLLHNNQDTIQYESHIFDKQQKAVGSLVFNVKYDKTQLYCGQKVANLDVIPQREPVTIYSGKCKTKNLFSYFDNYFDSDYEDNDYNWCESNYRDDTWGSQ